MDTDQPSRHPWWKRKRWIAAAALWLVVAYPLSVGPALWLQGEGFLPPSAVAAIGPVYEPLRWLTVRPDGSANPGFEWFVRYVEFFANL